MAPLLLFFVARGLRCSELRIDLEARTYERRVGLWPSPRTTAGSLDELLSIRLQGLWVELTGNRYPETWIDLVFRTSPLAMAQILWLSAPIGPVSSRIAVAALVLLGLLVIFLGKWKRYRIEQQGHFLRLSYDFLGRNRHQAFVHRDAVADLEVRRPDPYSLNQPILPSDRALVIRTTNQRFFYIGRHLDPGALDWLRKTVLAMLVEMNLGTKAFLSSGHAGDSTMTGSFTATRPGSTVEP